MNSKLYVGNLSSLVTEDDLRNCFIQAETVTSIDLIRDRHNGNSKGYAFVEMSTQSEAQQAAFMFNGRILGDHELRVKMAHSHGELGGGPNRGSWYPRRLPQRGGNKRY